MINELLTRVEGLTGPDEQTDCLLWQMAYPDQRVMFDAGKAFGPGKKRPAKYGRLADFPLDGWDDWHGVRLMLGATPLTASIDAALALVERKLPGWSVEIYIDSGTNGRAAVKLSSPGTYSKDYWGWAAPTAPLAIIAALLRALLAKGEGGCTVCRVSCLVLVYWGYWYGM